MEKNKFHIQRKHHSFKLLPIKNLQNLSNLTQTPTNSDQTIQILKKCEFFINRFRTSISLEEFVNLAKSSVSNEVHNYGTILLDEGQSDDKFYILLDGKVEKIRQNPSKSKSSVLKALNFETISSQSITEIHQAGSDEYNFSDISKKKRSKRVSIRVEDSFFDKKLLPETQSCRFDNSYRDGKSRFIRKNLKSSLLSMSNKEATTLNTSADLENSGFSYGSGSASKRFVRFCPPGSIKEIDNESDFQNDCQSNLNQEDQELIKFICKDNLLLSKRYFCSQEIPKATKIQTYQTHGEFFGENFCLTDLQKSSSTFIVSSKQARLLTLQRQDFQNIITTIEEKNQEKLQVFTNLFPLLNEKMVKRFSVYFKPKVFQINETIYSEDENSNDLYLLYSGEVKLFKAFHPSQDQNSLEIPVFTVIKNQFFGEETLLDIQVRQETAVANAHNTLVYIFNGNLYQELKEIFCNFFDPLILSAQEKFSWRKAKASGLFESERSSPIGILAYSSKKNFLSGSHSQRLSLKEVLSPFSSAEKKKSNCKSYFKPSSIFCETSPTNQSDMSIGTFTSEDSPAEKKNEQYKSQFGRTIILYKTGDETQSRDLRKSPIINHFPKSSTERYHLKNELSGCSNLSLSTSPQKPKAPKKISLIQQHTSVDNIYKEIKEPVHIKKFPKYERKSKQYIPTFTPVQNSSLAESEVSKIEACEETPKNKIASNNSLKLLIRKLKIH